MKQKNLNQPGILPARSVVQKGTSGRCIRSTLRFIDSRRGRLGRGPRRDLDSVEVQSCFDSVLFQECLNSFIVLFVDEAHQFLGRFFDKDGAGNGELLKGCWRASQIDR